MWENPKNNMPIREKLKISFLLSLLLCEQQGRSGEAEDYWPSSNVEGSVHDRDQLDPQTPDTVLYLWEVKKNKVPEKKQKTK